MAKSDALQAILAAISTGVPLYNRGDALGCLETYETVARGLLSTPDALPHGGASKLQHALAAAAHGSATERAWAMRHGLDDVLLLLRGGTSANEAAVGERGAVRGGALGGRVGLAASVPGGRL